MWRLESDSVDHQDETSSKYHETSLSISIIESLAIHGQSEYSESLKLLKPLLRHQWNRCSPGTVT
jgi:hypothetical protein